MRTFELGSACSRPASTLNVIFVRLLQLSQPMPPVNARSLLLSSQLSQPRVMPALIVKSPSLALADEARVGLRLAVLEDVGVRVEEVVGRGDALVAEAANRNARASCRCRCPTEQNTSA